MKKLLALLLAGVLACSALAGCGGDSDDAGSTTAAGSGAAEDSGSEAADGDFSGTIKIGVICPMSGTAGDGVYMEAACQLAADEINAAGGMDGLKVELYVEDDEGTAQKSVTVAQKLVNLGNLPREHMLPAAASYYQYIHGCLLFTDLSGRSCRLPLLSCCSRSGRSPEEGFPTRPPPSPAAEGSQAYRRPLPPQLSAG